MKRSLFALLIISIGTILIGIGLMQFIDTNIKINHSLNEAKKLISSPKTLSEETDGRLLPAEGETTGLLLIPRIDAELAIVEGTDPDDLEKGVGHYRDSFYPNENGQIVLSGHRDSVFRRMGELAITDIVEIQLPYGKYQYVITDTKIVDANDTSIITLQDHEEELILTTCYPFSFIGDAPDRYIIYAKRIDA